MDRGGFPYRTSMKLKLTVKLKLILIVIQIFAGGLKFTMKLMLTPRPVPDSLSHPIPLILTLKIFQIFMLILYRRIVSYRTSSKLKLTVKLKQILILIQILIFQIFIMLILLQEDCLSLNIYKPTWTDGPLPVFVWVSMQSFKTYSNIRGRKRNIRRRLFRKIQMHSGGLEIFSKYFQIFWQIQVHGGGLEIGSGGEYR